MYLRHARRSAKPPAHCCLRAFAHYAAKGILDTNAEHSVQDGRKTRGSHLTVWFSSYLYLFCCLYSFFPYLFRARPSIVRYSCYVSFHYGIQSSCSYLLIPHFFFFVLSSCCVLCPLKCFLIPIMSLSCVCFLFKCPSFRIVSFGRSVVNHIR